MREFTIIIERGDRFFIGYSPEIPGANGQGDTVEECNQSVKDAIELILSDEPKDEAI